MTFELNFNKMFNMNTMMNLSSMAGMGGFGMNGLSSGMNFFNSIFGMNNFNPFSSYGNINSFGTTGNCSGLGSVFNFYGGSSSGCCGTNYSTRSCSNDNAWTGVGAMLGYAGITYGVPLLTQGISKGISAIKANTNSSKQADVNDTLAGLREEKSNLLANLKVSESDLLRFDKNTDTYAQTLKNVWTTQDGVLTETMRVINHYNDLENHTTEDIAEYEKAVEKLEDDKNKVEKAKEEYEAYVAKMENAQAKLQELNVKIKAEEAKLDELKLDKADGNIFTRATANSFKKVYNLDEQKFQNGKSGSNISKADFRYLIGQYSSAATPESKEKYARAIANLLNEQSVSDNAKKAAGNIIDIIKKDHPNLF